MVGKSANETLKQRMLLKPWKTLDKFSIWGFNLHTNSFIFHNWTCT